MATISAPDRDGPSRAPWGMKEVLVAVATAAVTLAVISGGASLVLAALGIARDASENDPAAVVVLLLAQMVTDIVAVGVAATLSLRRYGLSPRAWGLRRERPIAGGACVAVLGASFATLAVYGLVVRALGLEGLEPTGNLPRALFEHRAVVPVTAFLVVVVAPLAEEMFFRGFVFNGLRRLLGVPGAAATSGVMWATIHGQVGLVAPITVIGFMFAVLLARTGSLWNAILVHLLFNLVGLMGNLTA